jgi:hypothetical protein
MDGEVNTEEVIEAEVVETSIDQAVKAFGATKMMAMAMIKAGMPRDEVCKQTGLSKRMYNGVYKAYDESNFDKLTGNVMESWECILKAKLMNVSELALDKTKELLENNEMKDAKMASNIFSEVFDKFRLATGKSTENIESTTLRLSQMIESRTGLQKPNLSQYHENVVPINTTPPSISEVM